MTSWVYVHVFLPQEIIREVLTDACRGSSNKSVRGNRLNVIASPNVQCLNTNCFISSEASPTFGHANANFSVFLTV